MPESIKTVEIMFGTKEKDPEICTCMCHDDPHSTKHVMACCHHCNVCNKNIDGLFWTEHLVKCQLPENLKERVNREKDLFSRVGDKNDMMRDTLYYIYIHKGAVVGDEKVMDEKIKEVEKLNKG